MPYKIFAIKIASYLRSLETCSEVDYGCSFVFYFYVRSNGMELAMGQDKYTCMMKEKNLS